MSLSKSIRKRHIKKEEQSNPDNLDTDDEKNKIDDFQDDKILSYSRSSTMNHVNIIYIINFRNKIKMTKNLFYQQVLLLAKVAESQIKLFQNHLLCNKKIQLK